MSVEIPKAAVEDVLTARGRRLELPDGATVEETNRLRAAIRRDLEAAAPFIRQPIEEERDAIGSELQAAREWIDGEPQRAAQERERLREGLLSDGAADRFGQAARLAVGRVRDESKGEFEESCEEEALELAYRKAVEAALAPDPVEGKECARCRGTGHDWEPGLTGEAVSIGPCPDCDSSGVKPEPIEEARCEETRLGYDLALKAMPKGLSVRVKLSLRRGEVEGTVVSVEDDHCLLDTSGIGCEHPLYKAFWAELDGFEILPSDDPDCKISEHVEKAPVNNEAPDGGLLKPGCEHVGEGDWPGLVIARDEDGAFEVAAAEGDDREVTETRAYEQGGHAIRRYVPAPSGGGGSND